MINSLFSWLGRKIRLTDGPFWSAFYGGGNWANRTVSVETAMNLSAWWACVRLISETKATLPIGVFERRRGENREAQPLDDHWLADLLRFSPNADQTPVEFWEGKAAAMCIGGNAYAEKVMNAAGDQVLSLERMPFMDVRPDRETDGRLVYRFTDRGRLETLPEEKVFHLRGFGIDGDLGLSPIAYARQTLGGALATEEASARVYGTGLRASGFLLSPQVLNKQQREQARKNLIEPLEGPEGEGKTGVLEAGWKWQGTNIPPKDAEMILSRKFNVEDICRWMRVPPVLVGHAAEGQTMWGSGIEQIMLGWLMLGLRAYLKRTESAIAKRIIFPAQRRTLYAEFNIEGLLRADSAGRAALMNALCQNGLRTRNEMRRLDNMPAFPAGSNGDEATVQSNMMLLRDLGRAPLAPPRVPQLEGPGE